MKCTCYHHKSAKISYEVMVFSLWCGFQIIRGESKNTLCHDIGLYLWCGSKIIIRKYIWNKIPYMHLIHFAFSNTHIHLTPLLSHCIKYLSIDNEGFSLWNSIYIHRAVINENNFNVTVGNMDNPKPSTDNQLDIDESLIFCLNINYNLRLNP